MSGVHPTAIVGKSKIGVGVKIGAYAVIGDGVELGANVAVHPHAVIGDHVVIGEESEIFPGAVVGKEPKGAGALARLPVFERRLRIGAGCSIGPHAVIYYDVVIGSHCLIGDAASIREQTEIGDRSVVGRHVTINYRTRIGSRTKIMDHCWIAGNAEIGDEVFIGGGVLTSNDNAPGRQVFDDAVMRGPTIGNGAMIGIGAILLPGVGIGSRAVVAAGAIVTKDVPAEATIMGAAARVRD
ncbi:MAG: DapH/DapD/GlmU-related protein [Reyranellaceae bacterium]